MRPNRMLTGPGVLRVVWLPGTDQLRGHCHCGAVHVADDPVEVWEWLLAHPVGHHATDTDAKASPEPVLVGADR